MSARTGAREAPRAPASLPVAPDVQRARLGARVERAVDGRNATEKTSSPGSSASLHVAPASSTPRPRAAAADGDPLGPARVDRDALEPGPLEQRVDVGLGDADERASVATTNATASSR